MNQIDMDARKKQAEGCGCNGCKTELDYINMIEVLRDRVADRERFIATLESGIHEENGVVLQMRAENDRLREEVKRAAHQGMAGARAAYEGMAREAQLQEQVAKAELVELRAENERLRAALQQINDWCWSDDGAYALPFEPPWAKAMHEALKQERDA